MIKDFLHTSLTRYLIILISFISSVLIARNLGAEGKGYVVGILIIPQLFAAYGSFSVNESFLFFIGKKEISLKRLNFFLAWVLVVQCPLLVILCYLYFVIIGSSSEKASIIIAVALIPLLLFLEILRFCQRGVFHIGKYNTGLLIESAVTLFFIGYSLFMDYGAFAIVVSYTAGYFFSLCFILFNFPVPEVSNVSAVSVIDLFSYGWKVHLFRILNVTEAKFDIFLISILLAPGELGLYSVAVSLSQLYALIVQRPVSTVILPYFLKMDEKYLGELAARVTRIVIFGSFILGVLLWGGGHKLLVLLYGNEFSAAYIPFAILLLGTLIRTPTATLNCYFKACGRPETLAKISSITAPINVCLCFAFIPMYGIVGAAIISAITYAVFAGYLLFRFSRETQMNLFDCIVIKIDDFKKLRQLIQDR